MCIPPISYSSDGYEFTLSEYDVERFQKALADYLSGEVTEPDQKVLREMCVRLKHATRRTRRNLQYESKQC
jgi:hypothetical protein